MPEPIDLLKKYWRHDSFRPLQSDIIGAVLNGKDTLALLPTGAGKSICFQVPALLSDGVCLVISPLIALMKDQISNLKKRGIPALSVNSGMGFMEVKKTLQNAAYGNFKFLYVSAERLESEFFLEYLPLIKLNLIAVDEAHCISQWGYDFRPSYLRIASLRQYFPKVPILALTASATLEVQKDIREKLLFGKSQMTFQQSFERPNLSYSVFRLHSKENKLITVLQKVAGSGLVYCKTRRRTKEIAELLNRAGIVADFYHAGLTPEQRSQKQEDWINKKTRIIVCTNAFGMGIDKPDVRTVVHYEVPEALENYYQEAGRAGRDSKKAYAVLLYSQSDLDALQKQIKIKFPSNEVIKKIYGALCSFLQLPANSGEGFSFDFDINTFSKNFKLDAYTVSSVLKILEQEELITYSEQFFLPAKVEFSIDKKQLNGFEKSDPGYSKVIQGLLRSYEGILDAPSFINEYELARLVGTGKENLVQLLKELTSLGIISYSPQKEKPQIYFIKNRVRTEELFISQKNILKRKLAYEERLGAMISYCTNENQCRSTIIGFYFSGKPLPPCGICDNCLRNKNLFISDNEFDSIAAEIQKLTRQKAVTSKKIMESMVPVEEYKIRKVLKFLQDQNLIVVNEEDLIKSI